MPHSENNGAAASGVAPKEKKKILHQIRNMKTRRLGWLHRNRFYSSTPIGGFNLIAGAKFQWEVVIWYIILISFLFLTIKNAYDVIDSFQNDPTVTETKVIEKNNSNLSVPDFRVSLLAPQLLLLYDFLEEFDPNGTMHETPYKNWPIETKKFYVNYVGGNLAQGFESKETFLNNPWKPTIVREFLLMLCGFSSSVGKMLPFIEKNFKELNISEEEFYMKLETEVKSLFGISLMDKNYKDITYLLRIYPTYFKAEGNILMNFLFHLQQNVINLQLRFTKVVNSTSLYEDPRFWFRGGSNSTMKNNSISDYISMDFSFRFSLYIGRGIRANIRRTGLFNSIIDECIPYVNREVCASDCLARHHAKTCTCRPYYSGKLNWTNPDNLYTFCPIYEEIKIALVHEQSFNTSDIPNYPCKSEEFVDEVKKRCNALCMMTNGEFHPCNRIFYEASTEADQSITEVDPDDTAFLKISVIIFDFNTFISFTESYRTSWSKFAAELGGIFDLWIGASIAGFVHLLIYIIKQCVYSFDRKTKTGSNLRGMFELFDPTVVAAPAAFAVEMFLPKTTQDIQPMAEVEEEIRDGEAPVGKMFNLIKEMQKKLDIQERKSESQRKQSENFMTKLRINVDEQKEKIDQQWKEIVTQKMRMAVQEEKIDNQQKIIEAQKKKIGFQEKQLSEGTDTESPKYNESFEI